MNKKLLFRFPFAFLCCIALLLPSSSYAAAQSWILHVGSSDSIGRKVNVEVASASSANPSIASYDGLSMSMISWGSDVQCKYAVKITGHSAGSTVITVIAADGSVIDTIQVTVTDHSWEKGSTTPSTCSTKGTQEYKCSSCSATKEDSLPLLDHTPGNWTITITPTCATKGKEEVLCSSCSSVLDSRSLPETTHDSGTWVTVSKASCKTAGREQLQCTGCGLVLEKREIAVTGHQAGDWILTKAATCNEKGSEEQLCTDCGLLLQTREISATGHKPGHWVVTKVVTCKESGSEEQRCVNCSALLDSRSIPAAGTDHTPGKWITAKSATCTTPGLEEQKCSLCNELLSSRPIPAAGIDHQAGKMTTVIEPTCTQDGKKEQHCTVCSAVLFAETLPAMGHTTGDWITTKEASTTEEGIQQLKCTTCDAILDSKTLPLLPQVFRNQTVCTFGVRFRDVKPEIITDSKQWYMFTPLDLSADGVYELPLIAANTYYVGNATVTVKDGTIMVTVEATAPAEFTDGTYTLLHDLDSVTQVKITKMKQYKFGQKINIEKELMGDTDVLLYVLCHANYDTSDNRIKRFSGSSTEYTQKAEALKDIMDPFEAVSVNNSTVKHDASEYETLKPGCDSQAVLDARIRLYELGYFKNKPTQTEYTNNMMNYVKQFEKDHQLTQDGILSPEDQAILFNAYTPLKPGSKGQAVLNARMKLYELGYFKHKPTQIEYTQNMKKYVKAFEKDHGLKQDGILSPSDQELLFSL